jgi:hypothetical protein
MSEGRLGTIGKVIPSEEDLFLRDVNTDMRLDVSRQVNQFYGVFTNIKVELFQKGDRWYLELIVFKKRYALWIVLPHKQLDIAHDPSTSLNYLFQPFRTHDLGYRTRKQFSDTLVGYYRSGEKGIARNMIYVMVCVNDVAHL